jgi:hypothetical protein
LLRRAMERGTLEQGPMVTRWLAWVVACVLLAGLISAGALVAAGDRPDSAVVTAAGGSRTIDVTSTVTVPITVPSTPAPAPRPTTTIRTTTTLSPAAVAVLRAIASSTTTTRPPPVTTTTTTAPPAPTITTPTPTPTTAPPAPTTTPPATGTSSSTTSTAPPPQVTLTLVNEHPQPLAVTVNGREFLLAVGQTVAAAELPFAPPGDEIVVRAQADADCGSIDKGALFEAGAAYRLNIVAGTVACADFARPRVNITRL